MVVHRTSLALTLGIVFLATGAMGTRWRSDVAATAQSPAADRSQAPRSEPEEETVIYPRQSWPAASLDVAPASTRQFTTTVRLTGKVTLNEDRVAHIYPLVEGIVDSVHARLGQHVEKGELLAVLHSREVGQAKLALYQARLEHDYMIVKDQRRQEVAKNTAELIAALRKDTPIDAIQETFRDRPMGEYRQQLLAAYAQLYKSNIDFERLSTLSESGAVAGKQFVTAEAARNADRATLQAWLEQIDHDIQNEAFRSAQSVQESQTRVAVAESNLKILGYDAEELAVIDPAREGEAISHYAIRAPFSGTVISKDVVTLERAAPETQILSIADLSSVWITADVYEEHLRLLNGGQGKTLTIRTDAWPGRTFAAELFYTGDVMDESSRTISMRAVADNRERMLKPGMFVNVEFPGSEQSDVLQLPESAIQEHEGEKFVFIHTSGDTFVRRDVTTGRTSDAMVEILSGIEAGDSIVVAGGFVLKSRMLADLMEGE